MAANLPLSRVCAVLGAPRSTVYHRCVRGELLGVRPGPVIEISDDDLIELISEVLDDSPFSGEGYRKVGARLRREHHVRVGGKRVLRLMRCHGLLAPQRGPWPAAGTAP